MTVLDKLTTTLKGSGYSLTTPRKLLFDALLGSDPLTMAELSAMVPSIDRATAYRTVALFERLGIVHRLQFGWKYKLELSDNYSHHHHHVTCQKCGKLLSIHEPAALAGVLAAIAKESNFVITTHQLELQGLCPDCK